MMKLLYGKEPYLLDVEKKKLLAKGAVLFHEFTAEVAQELMGASFFEERKTVVCDVDNLSKLDNKYFRRLIESPPQSSDLYVIVRTFDSHLKLAKELKKATKVEVCNYQKVSDRALQGFVLNTVGKRFGMDIMEDAYAEFMFRMGYHEEKAVCLYDVQRALESLCDASDGAVTLDLVQKLIPQRYLDRRFQIATYLKLRDRAALYEQAQALKGSETIKVLGLLAREFRVSYKAMYFSLPQIGARDCCFKDFSKKQLLVMMKVPLSIAYDIKIGAIPEDMALTVCFDRLLELVDEV